MDNPYKDAKGMKEKKKILRAYSMGAKKMVKLMGGEVTVNDVLLQTYADMADSKDFSTYKGWKAKGKQVKKGEKAFVIWSRPIKSKKTKAQEEGQENEEFSMFGIAHVFADTQVE